MARARSPNSIEAEEMYKNGMKLVDIAKKLDVPASTVRRWKSTQNWDGDTKKKKNERSQKKKTSARHKGGQLGNKNAVGNRGGPLKPGDKIAEKHGAFVIASAEIKKGQEVTATTGGKAAVATAGDYVIGVALNNVSAGGYSRLQLSKYQKAKA